MKDKSIKLRRHESFAIREGWLEKGLYSFSINGLKVFSKENGTKLLGIGSNMVKSLKYWMVACNIITNSSKTELTEFGKFLLKNDRYLEDDFSWWLIHYYLVTKKEESPILYFAYNIYKGKHINKDSLKEEVLSFYKEKGIELNDKLVSEDCQMYIRLYYNEDKSTNPEDNLISPLAKLKLLTKDSINRTYSKKNAEFNSLHYLVVYYSLINMYDDSFDISNAYIDEKSPCKIFNLEKGEFNQYITLMKNNGLITLNNTAGLNIVYFNIKLSLEEIVKMYKKDGGYAI